jgi:hypothetical protein
MSFCAYIELKAKLVNVFIFLCVRLCVYISLCMYFCGVCGDLSVHLNVGGSVLVDVFCFHVSMYVRVCVRVDMCRCE